MTTVDTSLSSMSLVPVSAESGVALPLSPESLRDTASLLAREYQEATAEIARLMLAIESQTERLRDAFIPSERSYNSFSISFQNLNRSCNADDPRIFTEMKRTAWSRLIDHLGIKSVMSVAKREEFDRQLEGDKLPDISEEAILGLVAGLADQAQGFAQEAAREVFDLLRPQRSSYKTNDKFRVGRRVILSYYVERNWNGSAFRISYHHGKHVRAIDAVFHLLDGKGVIREHKSPLETAIESCAGGKGETAYFSFRCFANRNLHLTFKNLELVKQLNLQAAGDYVLGHDAEE